MTGPSANRALIELLSSMRFAIALLVAICLAAVIGTVLPQGQALNTYVDQFGPFWTEVFGLAGLFRVYSTSWFIAMLAVLIASTSLCIYRTVPRLLADWRSYREDLRVHNLQAFAHRHEARLDGQPKDLAETAAGQLTALGWRCKVQPRPTRHPNGDHGIMLAAQKGGARKLGYVATHAAIVLICLGGLADGDLSLRAVMWLKGVTPFQGDGLISNVPAQHRLDAATPAYRANIAVAEGTQASTALIGQDNGVVLQTLPFSIELRRFIVDYYPTGMPKLFASEVVLHDPASGESRPARIEVNHPAEFKGVRIYQSSFEDGGSKLQLRATPTAVAARAHSPTAIDIQTQVGTGQPLQLPWLPDGWTLEPTDLRVMNVEPARQLPRPPAVSGANTDTPSSTSNKETDLRAVNPTRLGGLGLGAAARPDAERRFHNLGPSVSYRLRDASGQATEYVNYMQPVDTGDGWPMYLYGVRAAGSGEIAYWRIPADLNNGDGQADFWRLQAALTDSRLREAAIERYVTRATSPDGQTSSATRVATAAALRLSATRVLNLFAGLPGSPSDSGSGSPDRTAQPGHGGLQAISAFLESQVSADQRQQATRLLVDVLNGVLFQLLQVARTASGLAPLTEASATGSLDTGTIDSYMRMTVLAFNDARLYPAPVLLDLVDFQQVQASVFQVTRSPGQPWVYLGCLLLVLGVFAMLYVRDRRLWLWLPGTNSASAQNAGEAGSPPALAVHAQLAYSCNRLTRDAQDEFDRLRRMLLGETSNGSLPPPQSPPST